MREFIMRWRYTVSAVIVSLAIAGVGLGGCFKPCYDEHIARGFSRGAAYGACH